MASFPAEAPKLPGEMDTATFVIASKFPISNRRDLR